MTNTYQNLKTANTIEEVRAVFAKQLDETPKCDGEYLKSETVAEAAAVYLDNIIKQFPGVQMTLDQALETMERKVKEFAEHKGEAQLFYMREVVDKENSTETNRKLLVQVLKIWESQLSELIGVPYMPSTLKDGLPRFIQHNVRDTPDIKIG